MFAQVSKTMKEHLNITKMEKNRPLLPGLDRSQLLQK